MLKKIKILLVVGEASGDTHAAKLVSALRKKSPSTDFEFFGTTGGKMREVGVETIVRADDFARVGIIEVANALPMFLRVFKKVKSEAIKRKPDVVVLIDFPDFNLKLATALKKKGMKTIFYISPQVWAWKKYRVKRIKKYVDLLLTILPFEKDWYAKNDFHRVTYVGNPLAGEIKPKLNKKQFCEKYGLEFSQPIIALLPGSRRNEIDQILRPMIEAASIFERKSNNAQFVVALASNRKVSEVESVLQTAENAGSRIPRKIVTVKDETYDVLNASDTAAVASGTATLETAILGTPMVIVYKVSNLNYQVLRHFVSIDHIGLVNLIAGKKIAKELIQDEFTPEKLSAELESILEPHANSAMRLKLANVKAALGEGGASKKAAEAILNEINS